MSKSKLAIGVLLIILSFSVLFISVIPNIYSNNSAGKIYKQIDVDYDFLKNENEEYVLLYFGYVGCSTICPVAMDELSQIYKKLDTKKFSFYFINLLKDTDEKSVQNFAKAFNKEFKAVYIDNKKIMQIVSELNVKYLPSIIDKYEIDHSSFLYVLKKQDNIYQQKFIYTTRPFDIDYITNDLAKL